MKKICFVTTVYNTLKGFVLEFAEYLHDEGQYDITFICNYDERLVELLPDYIRFIPVKMKRGIDIGGVKSCIDLFRIFRKEKFDIIQYSTPNASCYASLASWMANAPVRLYCQWGLAFDGFSGLKQKVFFLIEKMICALSTKIEPDSYGNLNRCRDLGLYSETKSSVVHYGSASGVSLEQFDVGKKAVYRREKRAQYQIPENAFTYGFVGSITGDKGINELLSASKYLIEKYDDIYLMLVGPSEKEDSLNTELMNWANEEKRVIFCGFSKEAEKDMAAMDCYVTASYREGFGTTVIEAGAMALPVITSNIPGPTDAIADEFNGLVFENKNIAQLISAMEKMYKNREMCEAMGIRGLENVRVKYNRKELFEAMLQDRNNLVNQ